MAKKKRKQKNSKTGGGFGGANRSKAKGMSGRLSKRRVSTPFLWDFELSAEGRVLNAKEALEEDSDDLLAQKELILYEEEQPLEQIVEALESLVEKGKEANKELLAKSKQSGGIERDEYDQLEPLLEVMYELGRFHQLVANFDRAIEIFEELLKLSPIDKKGVRYDALVSYSAKMEDLDKLDEFIQRYPTEQSADFLYAKAYLEFIRALEQAIAEEWVDESKEIPFQNVPDRIFGKALSTLETAVQTYPWSIWFLLEEKVKYLVKPLGYECGSPGEALLHAQRCNVLWFSNVILVNWLLSRGPAFIQASEPALLLGKYSKHIEEIADALEDVEFDDSDDMGYEKETLQTIENVRQMVQIAKHIILNMSGVECLIDPEEFGGL